MKRWATALALLRVLSLNYSRRDASSPSDSGFIGSSPMTTAASHLQMRSSSRAEVRRCRLRLPIHRVYAELQLSLIPEHASILTSDCPAQCVFDSKWH
jgi:hypothetical protein